MSSNEPSTPTTITPEALAKRWNCSLSHLATMRSQEVGPAFTKPAGKVVYLVSEVERIERLHTVRTTK